MAQEAKRKQTWTEYNRAWTTELKSGYILIGSAIGLLVSGLPPSLIFGHSLYSALVKQGWPNWLAFLAGASLALVNEVVGALAAYVAQQAVRTAVQIQAIIIWLSYFIVGVVYMIWFESNDVVKITGIVSYFVAPLLNWAVALLTANDSHKAAENEEIAKKEQKDNQAKQNELEANLEAKEATRLANEAKQKQDEQDRLFAFNQRQAELKWQHEEAQKRAEREHEAKMLALKLKAETELEKVKAKQGVASSRKDTSNLTETYQDIGNDYRTISEKVKRTFLDFTVEEIMKNYNLSKKTAGRFKKYAIRDFTQLAVNGNGVHHG